MTHEREPMFDPKEQLIALLSVDYRTAEEQSLELTDTGFTSLKAFIAKARDPERIIERFESNECEQLAENAAQALDSAAITDAFKDTILGHIIKAYTWEQRVAETFSARELGLLDGNGIFDPKLAQELEARALRGFLYDTVNKCVLVPDNREDRQPIIRNPGEYAQLMDVFDAWTLDYVSAYGEDAFAGIDPGMYLDIAQPVQSFSKEETQKSGWGKIFDQLRKLREEDENS